MGMSVTEGKRILITGACGTIGSELTKQILTKHQPKELLAMDNNESGIFFLEQNYSDFENFTTFLGDILDRDKLCRRAQGIDLIFHCAAFKHVEMCERSPMEAVQTNILGVQNVIYAAFENSVGRVLFTSSDKAVNPTNVMGTSKLMGERLMTSANTHRQKRLPLFFTTRFGNVLGSRGSVLPVFDAQIKNGGPVTLTDQRMSRFVMTAQDAVRLVLDTVQLGKGGEVFVTKMPVVMIKSLAAAMIEELAPKYGYDPEKIEIKLIGSKPGEKLFEELMNGEEISRAIELKDYFVILPAFRGFYHEIEYIYPGLVRDVVEMPYISSEENSIKTWEVKRYLKKNGLLSAADCC